MDKRSVWIGRGSRLLVLLAAVAVVPACGNGGAGGPTGITVNLSGGNATAATGGQGGYVYLYGYVGGKTGIVTSGTVDTSMPLPALDQPYLGTNVLVVSSNGTLAVGNGNSTGGATGAYLTAGSSTLNNASGVVTGIWIQGGVTLTINANRGSDTAGAAHSYAHILVQDGWFIEGTIRLANMDATVENAADGTNVAGIYFDYPNSFVMTGKIDTSAPANGAGAGGNGGYVQGYPYNVNSAGPINTSGGDGSTDGGTGGWIDFESEWGWFINRGDITTKGGNGVAGVGGDGGTVDIYANDYSILYNSGSITSTGGNGTTGGGTGGHIYIDAEKSDIVNVGTLSSFGGNATVSGNAGDGGYISFYGDYGGIRTVATYDSHGGDAAAGNGGSAGYVQFQGWSAYSYATTGTSHIPDTGSVYVSGPIIAHGGNGTTGAGDGGYLDLESYTDYNSTAAGTTNCLLVGYSSIQKSGGDGTTGGYSDYVGIYGYYTEDDYSLYYACSVQNDVDITAKGGTGSAGAGGDSNYFDMETYGSIYLPYNYGATNNGNVDLSGGNGSTSGGSPGYVYVWGDFYIRNNAAFTCNGGNGDTGNGNDGVNDIELYATGPITNNGALFVNGGNSNSGNGGSGGDIYLYGSIVTNNAVVQLRGGNSVSGTGGNGGYIELFSDLKPSTTTVALDVSAGSGATGTPTGGDVWIDSVHLVGP